MADAKNKTKATGGSVPKFLAALDDERRKDCKALVALMRRATKSEPKMWGPSIVGFGDYHYKYPSGRESDWFMAGFSPRKKEFALYLMGSHGFDDPLMEKLGKHKTGGGCLYIQRMSDVDAAVLEKLVARSVRNLKQRAK